MVSNKDNSLRVSESCPQHGAYEAREWQMPFGGKVLRTACPVCLAERKREEASLKEEGGKWTTRRILHAAGIGARYHDVSFDNYRTYCQKAEKHLADLRKYAAEFDRVRSPNIVMLGLPGLGKTHLAAAIVGKLVRKDVSVIYTPLVNLFGNYNDILSDAENGTRNEFFSRMAGVDLLIVDEVGVMTPTASEQTVLHRIIDTRYSHRLPTVMISNLNADEFAKFVGERAIHRIMESAMPMEFDWSVGHGN